MYEAMRYCDASREAVLMNVIVTMVVITTCYPSSCPEDHYQVFDVHSMGRDVEVS